MHLNISLDHTSKKLEAYTPILEKMSQTIEDTDAFHSEMYCAYLDKVAREFSLCFGELDVMEYIAACLKSIYVH